MNIFVGNFAENKKTVDLWIRIIEYWLLMTNKICARSLSSILKPTAK